MIRVTEETKKAMKKLRDEGMIYEKIGESLGFSSNTIQYHLKPECKKKKIKRASENPTIWKGKKKYMKEYMANRYKTDGEFRDRVRKHARNYWRRKRE